MTTPAGIDEVTAHLLLDLMPDAAVLVAKDGTIAMVNTSLQETLGFDESELVGLPVETLVPEDRRGAHAGLRARYEEAPHRRPMATGLDLFARTKDGGTVALDISLSPMVVQGVPHTLAAMRDVSRRVEARERLLESESRFRAMLESLPQGVAIVSAEGRIREANPAMVQMFGRPPEGLVEPRRSDRMCRDATGRELRVEFSFGPLSGAEDTNGRPAVLAVLADVTERHRTQEALRAREAEQRALRRIATAVGQGVEIDEILEQVAREVADLLRVPAAAVIRFADEEGRAVGSFVEPSLVDSAPSIQGPFSLSEEGAAGGGGGVKRSGTSARATYTGSGRLGRYFLARGLRSALAAPVRVNGHLWGAIAVVGRSSLDLAKSARSRLERFSTLVAMAIANAEARDRLKRLAETDPLTGLVNLRAFKERLIDAAENARRAMRPLSLVLVDLDGFKRVNDAFGHAEGDRVLSEVASEISRLREGEERLARVGGDVFALILPGLDGAGAVCAAERVRAAIASLDVGPAGRLRASAGVCELGQAADAADLFRLADGALYWAKARGRDTVVLYDPAVVTELSAEERAARLERARSLAALTALARAVDAKDPATRAHSVRVSAVAVQMAAVLRLGAEETIALSEAGLVHDVGKIGIPDAVLLKPGALTSEEYEEIKKHAALGADIVHNILSDQQVAWVRYHHERWDGTGYPDGLEEEEIPVGARILAVADAWDVMTVARFYRAPVSPEEALTDCRAHAGTQFWPDGVDAIETLHAHGGLSPVSMTGRPG